MKKVLFAVTAGCFMLVLAACGGGSGSPKGVAEDFFKAMQKQDFEQMEKLSTKESKSLIGMMKMGMSMSSINKDSLEKEAAKGKIEAGEAKIEGDNATVPLTLSDGKGKSEKIDVRLKKEEGAWKVAFDKNSLMQMGSEKMKEKGASEDEMKQAEDAMKMLDSDSLKGLVDSASKAMKEGSKQLEEASKKLEEAGKH